MSLRDREIAIVKGMLARGDRQSDIAAYFGVNGGRIAEINTGAMGGDLAPARPDDLPRAGPYFVSARAAIRAEETLVALRDLIDETLIEIQAWKSGGAA